MTPCTRQVATELEAQNDVTFNGYGDRAVTGRDVNGASAICGRTMCARPRAEARTAEVDNGITIVLKIEFDCRPGAIAVSLVLQESKYQETAAYWHVGREPVQHLVECDTVDSA